MPRHRASLVYVGIRNHVVAFDRKNGQEVWRTRLPSRYGSSASFVNVVRDAEGLFATCAGELFALDPRNGTLLWHDPLKGLGTGLMTLASDLGAATPSGVLSAAALQRAAASTAATTAAT